MEYRQAENFIDNLIHNPDLHAPTDKKGLIKMAKKIKESMENKNEIIHELQRVVVELSKQNKILKHDVHTLTELLDDLNSNRTTKIKHKGKCK